MTEFVEGAVKEVTHFADGSGGYVRLDQDKTVYYFEGNMDVPLDCCRLEIKDGEGTHVGEKLIVSIRKMQINPAIPDVPPQQMTRMIQMPLAEFTNIIQQRSLIPDSRIRALTAAVGIYQGMNKKEKDPLAAVDEVKKIANAIEAHLV